APIREEIDLVKFPLNRTWQAASSQADGNDEDLVEGHAPRAVERIPDLGLEASPLVYRPVRVAGHEEIRRVDGILDGTRPVLPGQEFSGVHPWAESHGLESVVDALSRCAVLRDVSDENLRQGVRFEAEAGGLVGMKGAQPVDFHSLAGGDGAD